MSNRLPAVKPAQVLRALQRAGFYICRIRGSHHYLKHGSKPDILVCVPLHTADLKRGTLQSIIDQTGLSVDEFIELL